MAAVPDDHTFQASRIFTRFIAMLASHSLFSSLALVLDISKAAEGIRNRRPENTAYILSMGSKHRNGPPTEKTNVRVTSHKRTLEGEFISRREVSMIARTMSNILRNVALPCYHA